MEQTEWFDFCAGHEAKIKALKNNAIILKYGLYEIEISCEGNNVRYFKWEKITREAKQQKTVWQTYCAENDTPLKIYNYYMVRSAFEKELNYSSDSFIDSMDYYNFLIAKQPCLYVDKENNYYLVKDKEICNTYGLRSKLKTAYCDYYEYSFIFYPDNPECSEQYFDFVRHKYKNILCKFGYAEKHWEVTTETKWERKEISKEEWLKS